MFKKLVSYIEKNQNRLLSHTIYKNSKQIKGLTVRPDIIKLLEENIGNKFFDISLSSIFLDIYRQSRKTKAKMNKRDYIKLKSFCTVKETVNKTKRPPTEWEKIFAKDVSDKGLRSKIYKDLIQLNIKNTNNPSKK